MAQLYNIASYSIDSLLAWVRDGEIAIPAIQRPVVWKATQVRDLLDSLYKGYPVGYLITWRNPSVRLKDGSQSSGKRILIDGQQRITALMAALLGEKVRTKDYKTERIRIAFHPVSEQFEVSKPTHKNAWIPDLKAIFSPDASPIELIDDYAARNPGADRKHVSRILEGVRKITNNHVGVIELDEELDLQAVHEIFTRVNSFGVSLSQADFVMSKIAADDSYDGHLIYKTIDYFCHLVEQPEALTEIEKDDEFANSEFFPKLRWLKAVNDNIYNPKYTDMLRVAFISKFGRGMLSDLIALLSGRNFETKQYEEAVAEDAFGRLKAGVSTFINKTNFDRLTMILRSAGFINSKLIHGQNAINMAFVLYLRGREEGMPAADIERFVQRWFVMSVLSGRYTGSSETAMDRDIRRIEADRLINYCENIITAELSDNFWTTLLPMRMETSNVRGPFFLVFQAAQAKLNDPSFLARSTTVHSLLLNRGDVHHVYPRDHLKNGGIPASHRNQIANLVLAQSEINSAIGNKAPEVYFAELAEQCNGGTKKYGSITTREEMNANFRDHCLPDGLPDGEIPTYDDFLKQRRKLMAGKIKEYFKSL